LPCLRLPNPSCSIRLGHLPGLLLGGRRSGNERGPAKSGEPHAALRGAGELHPSRCIDRGDEDARPAAAPRRNSRPELEAASPGTEIGERGRLREKPMTESDWLNCTKVGPMLRYLERYDKASARKLRLLGAACCRRIWRLLPDDGCREAIDACEQYADGFVDK